MCEKNIGIYDSIVVIGKDASISKTDLGHNNAKAEDNIQEASHRLKERYIKQLNKWTVPVVKLDEGFDCAEKDREQFMVDLHMIERRNQDEDSLQFNEISRYLERRSFTADTVQVENLFKHENGRIFLPGVAGVGKTSFVEHLALLWAKGKHLSDFDFVFLLKCRNLIGYNNKAVSTQDLFDEQFAINVAILKKAVNGDRVLIIIDGLDELPSLEQVFHDSDNPLNSILHNLIKKESALFPGHKCILTGRPHLQTILLNHELDTIGKMNIFEITGFSRATIAAYVENFASGKEDVKTHIMNTIEESASLQAMASIPQFLSSLCSILATKATAYGIHRTTELYIWVLISFIRQHFSDFKEMPYMILKDARFRNFIAVVSQISYELLMANKVVFKEHEFGSLGSSNQPLEKKMLDSFLVKIETTTECLYQFKHVSLQEFLASVYCFRAGISIEQLLDMKMYVTASFVAGLVRAAEKQTKDSNDIPSMFADSVINEQNSQCCIQQDWQDYLLLASRPTVESIALKIFDRVRLRNITWRPFFAIFFELFHKDDKVPSSIAVFEEVEFSFDHMNTIEYVHFVHWMEIILQSFGNKSLSCITLRLLNSRVTEKKRNLALLVKHVRNLKFIACYIDMEFIDSMCKSIESASNDSNLEIIDLSNCALSEEHLVSVSHCLPFIKRMEICYNKLTKTGVSGMTSHLVDYQNSDNVKFKELRLHGCTFDDEVIPQLCKAIPAIQTMDFTRTQLNEQNIKDIVECIVERKDDQDTCKLENLVLERCGLDDISIAKLCEVIPSLNYVNLSRSAFGPHYIEFGVETIDLLAQSIGLSHENNTLRLKKLVVNFFSRSEEVKQRFMDFKALGIDVTFALW